VQATRATFLSDFALPNGISVTEWEGGPLMKEHRGLVQLVVSHPYCWKSARWLRRINFTDIKTPGS
jgi:DMSO/TMAO reductase YedYZ molybdopterin-dependent catalytic subunit